MRQAISAFLVLAAALASTAAAPARPAATTASCAKADLHLVHAGALTVGTDNPAYPPWFGGNPPKGSKWKVSDPTSGKGFESAVAYAVAAKLGFGKSDVHWTYVPFNRSFAPGSKSFDFDINQISYSAARAKVVTFSASYYDVNQALVVLAGSKIAHAKTIADVRGYKLGAQVGSTAYAFIKDTIKPSTQAAVYQQNAAAIQALKNRQIDGLVVDLPTAFYISAVQVDKSKVFQFPASPGGEHFGMVFGSGDPLAACVDGALGKLKADGTLARIQQQWLANVAGAPVLK